MRIALALLLTACGTGAPTPGGAIELSGSKTGSYERDPTSLTCEPTYVMARYLRADKELLLITVYLNSVHDGNARVALDDSKNSYSVVGSARLAISKHDSKTAYELTFDPAVDFVQSDYANAHPHTPGGADRKVNAKGTTTIVCAR